jgi:hypothetical protein
MDLSRAVNRAAAFVLLAVLAASLTTSSASAQPSTPGHNGTLQAQEGGAGGWNFYGAVYG